MPYNVSPNMSLPVPSVGTTPGPDYATNGLNASLSIIDQHDHSAGNGVQITPAGLNISSDLPFLSNNAIGIRSARFTAQASPLALGTDLDCVYVSGVDLYYNDGNGNQVRLTQSGSIAGTSGSIGNLTSPASATYVSATPAFVFQSAASTPANLDGGSLVLRNISANSKGITLNPPNALAANYSVTLPAALPGSTKIMSLDSSGNVGAAYSVDNSTLEISANTIQVKDVGITTAKLANSSVTTAKIADANVTRPKLEDVGQQTSAAYITSGDLTSSTFVTISGLNATITTGGRPVIIGLEATPDTGSYVYANKTAAFTSDTVALFGEIQFFDSTNSVALSTQRYGGTFTIGTPGSGSVFNYDVTPGAFTTPPIALTAGTRTLVVKIRKSATQTTAVGVVGVKLTVYEL